MPAKAKLTTRERTTSNVSSDNLNKGSELSHAEADSNFINLRDQTIAISDGSTSSVIVLSVNVFTNICIALADINKLLIPKHIIGDVLERYSLYVISIFQ